MNHDKGIYGNLKDRNQALRVGSDDMLRTSVFMCLDQTTQNADRSLRMTEMGNFGKEADRPSCRQSGYSCLTDTGTYLLHVV